MSSLASVWLWGTNIGAVSIERPGAVAEFEFHPDFIDSGIEVAPIQMPLGAGVYSFSDLSRETFRGLPGMLADSLPDRFGNALIDAWLAREDRSPADFDAVERLCYLGSRAIGALEFRPELRDTPDPGDEIRIADLVDLASEALASKEGLVASLAGTKKTEALREILAVGISAGGARAKAVIAWNPETGDVRSGQADAPPGFEQWLLKFDGVSDSSREMGGSAGYGAIEFAYSRMAAECGIDMEPCRLMEEGGRRHFMTRRFDRTPDGDKVHMQSLGAIAHLDFNLARAHGYEQAFAVLRTLGIGTDKAEQQFRRMVFNVAARNCDDHVKNIAFLMDRRGTWRLSPAFDMTYAFNPSGQWTSSHQMTVNGKSEAITREDILAVAKSAGIGTRRANTAIEEVVAAVRDWPEIAAQAGVDEERAQAIGAAHLTGL